MPCHLQHCPIQNGLTRDDCLVQDLFIMLQAVHHNCARRRILGPVCRSCQGCNAAHCAIGLLCINLFKVKHKACLRRGQAGMGLFQCPPACSNRPDESRHSSCSHAAFYEHVAEALHHGKQQANLQQCNDWHAASAASLAKATHWNSTMS